MAVKSLASYEEYLYGCRFCPMCKPAAEVANITQLESHTTRARGMLLWRYLHDMTELTPRAVELLYQSTLDSISEAWCVNHYPVSAYTVSARAEAFGKGLAPEPVLEALGRRVPAQSDVRGDVLLLGSEAAEIGEISLLEPASRVLERAGHSFETLAMPSGAIEYCLGALKHGEERAREVVSMIEGAGATSIIADGPETLWALTRVYPLLEATLPVHIEITSISALLAKGVSKVSEKASAWKGKRALLHDSRSACALGERMAHDAAIQPGFQGPEETMGTGEVYEASRQVVDTLGVQRLNTVWTRSLSRSCGADDGLWLTYPRIAEQLACERLREAELLGAELMITDSLLCAWWLRSVRKSTDVEVCWLPELLV